MATLIERGQAPTTPVGYRRILTKVVEAITEAKQRRAIIELRRLSDERLATIGLDPDRKLER